MRFEPLPGERDPGVADAWRGALVGSESEPTERSGAIRIWHNLFAWRIQHHEREQLGREGERLPRGQASAAHRPGAIRAGANYNPGILGQRSAPTGTVRAGNAETGLTSQSVIAAAADVIVPALRLACRSAHAPQYPGDVH